MPRDHASLDQPDNDDGCMVHRHDLAKTTPALQHACLSESLLAGRKHCSFGESGRRAWNKGKGQILNDHALVGRYPDKWVAVWQGEVRAAEDDLDIQLKVLDKNDVPRSEKAIRFIEAEPDTLMF